MTETLSALPKWARDKIAKLEADVAYFRKQARQVNGEEDTDTFVRGFFSRENQRLPKGARVSFVLDTKDGILGEAAVHLEDLGKRKTLVVRLHDMVITPRSSSTIAITQRRN